MTSETLETVATDAGPLSVVIVDDTPDLRDLLRMAFRRDGYDIVGEAGDGRQGIEVVREERPDVVLLDLAMPVMDGIEALPSIRRLVPRAKIVVLSGFGAQQMSARAVTAGADGYVQKGAPLNSILGYVRDLVDGGPHPTPRTIAVVPSARPAGSPGADQVARRQPLRTLAVPDTREDGVSTREALALAPYGVVELADEPLFRLVHTNAQGARLLGGDRPGTPLATLAPELASLVSFHRLDTDATFEVEIQGRRLSAALRRTGWSLLLYLDSTSEDVGMLRRAIATAAHEVRGPVAVLCGIAETMAWDGDLVDADQNARLIASAARQARILDLLTADLLTAAQIQRGTLRVDVAPLDVRALVEGAVADRFDAAVVVDDERMVRADPLRVEQMVTNLLSNAVKYGAGPFTVHVHDGAVDESADESVDGSADASVGGSAGGAGNPPMVRIDVIDRGTGVPPEFREHLFREFTRAPGAVATGTGLGLYVVRTLARAQGGDVTYAEHPAGGSVFSLTLPAC